MIDKAGNDRQGDGLQSRDIPGFDSLVELALNLRWSWNHATDARIRDADLSQ